MFILGPGLSTGNMKHYIYSWNSFSNNSLKQDDDISFINFNKPAEEIKEIKAASDKEMKLKVSDGLILGCHSVSEQIFSLLIQH